MCTDSINMARECVLEITKMALILHRESTHVCDNNLRLAVVSTERVNFHDGKFGVIKG
jgi:hypothetical protein